MTDRTNAIRERDFELFMQGVYVALDHDVTGGSLLASDVEMRASLLGDFEKALKTVDEWKP
jgi:hypothetical protein